MPSSKYTYDPKRIPSLTANNTLSLLAEPKVWEQQSNAPSEPNQNQAPSSARLTKISYIPLSGA